jgi:hypothetical protein
MKDPRKGLAKCSRPTKARCLRKFADRAVGWERDDLVRGGKT